MTHKPAVALEAFRLQSWLLNTYHVPSQLFSCVIPLLYFGVAWADPVTGYYISIRKLAGT